MKLNGRRREGRLLPHTWVYHTPPTESSRRYTVKYGGNEDYGEVQDEVMKNVGSDEKEHESGHFVDMRDSRN